MADEVVGFAGKDERPHLDSALAQALGEVDGFDHVHIHVLVAVDQQYR